MTFMWGCRMVIDKLRKMIGGDVYSTFPIQDYKEDLQGWRSKHHIFERVISAVQPKLLVEIGVWKGGSSVHMADTCRRLGLNAHLISIDTWLGSIEHFSNEQHDQNLNRLNGYPQIYRQFVANVILNNLQDYITPLPLPSSDAMELLRRLDCKADIIHVDGAHDYDMALRDLHASWEVLNDDGIIIVDDYLAWRGVSRAAYEFCAAKDAPLVGLHGKAAICKSSSENRAIQYRFDVEIKGIKRESWKQLR